MLPSASKARHRLSSESVPWCLETSLFLRLPFWDRAPSLPLLSLFLSFVFFPTSFWRQWAAFLGAWCPLPGIQKLFCGIYSAFKCSSDEFVGEKVVSPSYSSTILGTPPRPSFSISVNIVQNTLVSNFLLPLISFSQHLKIWMVMDDWKVVLYYNSLLYLHLVADV